MYRSEGHTRIHTLGSSAGWKVYVVRTESSEYHVGLLTPGDGGGRRIAALRGYSKRLGRMLDVQDSDPRIAGKSLFDVPTSDWAGFPLEIGAMITSSVLSVAVETDASNIASITAIMRGSDPRREAPPASGVVPIPTASTAPLYPESLLVTLDRAARHLGSVASWDEYARDLGRATELRKRALETLAACEAAVARIRRGMGA